MHAHAHHVHTGHYKSCIDPGDCWCEVRRLSLILAITVGILALQVIGGVVSGSLALLADAGHVFGDSSAFIVALVAAVLVKYGSDPERVRGLAFYINAGLLFLIAGWILYEAFERISEPREIDSILMIVVAFFGGIGNYVQHRLLEGAADEHRHEVHASLSLHVISDLMQSIAVVFGGIVIWATDFVLIDPILSFGIACWIVYRTIQMLRSPTDDHGCHHHH